MARCDLFSLHPVEGHAVLNQVADALGRVFGENAHQVAVDETAGRRHGVAVMNIRAVGPRAVARRAHTHDFAGPVHRASTRAERSLDQNQHLGAGQSRRQCSARRRPPATHDHHVGGQFLDGQPQAIEFFNDVFAHDLTAYDLRARATMLRRTWLVPPKIWNSFDSR